MKFQLIECMQRSGEWYKARLGRLTGSRAVDMLATRKDRKEAAARANYRNELVCERITGVCADEDSFTSKEMQHGIDKEAEAFAAYEAAAGQIVYRSGFVQGEELLTGSSVDGYVGEFRGVLELKCPKSTTHLGYLLGDVIPEDYLPQMTHHLWITGAAWCDFASFDDRFPKGLQLFVRRLYREAVDLVAYEAAALAFLEQVAMDEASVRLKVAA